jgi:hypothetical protein
VVDSGEVAGQDVEQSGASGPDNAARPEMEVEVKDAIASDREESRGRW